MNFKNPQNKFHNWFLGQARKSAIKYLEEDWQNFDGTFQEFCKKQKSRVFKWVMPELQDRLADTLFKDYERLSAKSRGTQESD